MTTSMKKQEQEQLYGEYINPTIDQYTTKQENPLVLMAQACNNIGKELSSSSSSSSTTTISITSKQRKSNSSPEVKKSLKRAAPSTPSPPAKKILLSQPTVPSSSSSSSLSSSPLLSTNQQQSFYFPPSPLMFDSFLLHHLNKTFTSSPFFTSPLFGHSSSSAFSPSSSQRSPYFMDSILAPLKPSPQPPAFVCNWMESTSPDGFCGKRFPNHMNLLEHLCTAHTSLSSSSMKSSYPTSIFSSYYSPTSVGKL
ncbi:unnamed protein product [Adineta steineri]|uniref:C2H2-type domain-containing protein n=1 Tax=Adineta steineri TaxID=433720 RepID=A0A818H0L7_9BILA|nr:unnamed protein product [Adineta steineri]CAF0922737.1 unnamed protein product [Adineta steineri]CAF3499433.1 unnamed protein product [Adineta steineri]CAF3517103.1 unnamed protein product [Adineta steineri]